MRLICLFAILISGCTASWVTRMHDPDKGGVVKYLDSGMGFVVEKRREDAEVKMKEYCGGSYQIVKESYDSNWTTYTATTNYNTTVITPNTSEYLHIYFKCK